MAGYKKKPIDLGEMADKVNEALTRLWDAGYEKEVRTIRDFIHAEGNFFREVMNTNREVTAELNKQLAATQRRTFVPIVKDIPESIRRPPPIGALGSDLCQYYELPAMAGRHPGTMCALVGDKRIDDVIPALRVCARHYSDYQKNKRGTIIDEERLR